MREGSWLRNTHIRMDTRQLLAGARVAHPGPAAYEAWPWRTSWPHPLYNAGFGTATSWLLDSRCRTRIKSIHSQDKFIWTGLDPHLQREEKGVSSIATSSHHTRFSIITRRPTQRIQHSTALSLSLSISCKESIWYQYAKQAPSSMPDRPRAGMHNPRAVLKRKPQDPAGRDKEKRAKGPSLLYKSGGEPASH